MYFQIFSFTRHPALERFTHLSETQHVNVHWHDVLESVSLTWAGIVLQGHNKLGSLPEPLQEDDHQVPYVLGVTGGERVLVSFDGGQSEALGLKLPSSDKHTDL